MSSAPVEAVIAVFDDENAADQALSELKTAKWEGLIGIEDAAVLRRDEDNKLHIKETGDMSGKKGAAIGAVLGGTIGLITGPGAILVGGAGALIGGLAAKLRDSGFSDERLEKLGEGLTPGSSAIVSIIEHKWVNELEKQLAEAGADVATEILSEQIAAQLQKEAEPA
ncbi:hypothetical protein BMS3Abin01_00381 [bacterium BMS3Abin01]|nr:hypothetical protein BMS3Abin01_00381 [bacterium BMS3Abin01]HDZ59979.1 DUF1269 domain-containing protein [Actinomycetota bacterium]